MTEKYVVKKCFFYVYLKRIVIFFVFISLDGKVKSDSKTITYENHRVWGNNSKYPSHPGSGA